MDSFKKGWFTETGPLWPGQAMSLEIEKVLFEGKSKYQDVLVAETKTWGRALFLDGVIQLTQKDEMSYQEMMAHVPIFAHPNPKSILIIGAGDGGVIREVLKHKSVERVVHCEIDEMVMEVSQKYLPDLFCGRDDPRLTTHVGCGMEFMKNHQNEFDVIITDSSDPIGPASVLFESSYFNLLRKALKSDGVICSQGETYWSMLELIVKMQNDLKELFPSVSYGVVGTPTYPNGHIGYFICSKDSENVVSIPKRTPESDMDLKYYSEALHKASFVHPKFVSDAL